MVFKKGLSGNPAGRRSGSRNRATEMVEHLLEGEAEAISRKAIELALEGNPVMLKLCLERIAPARKGRAVEFELNPASSIADLATSLQSIMKAMGDGLLSPDEAAAAAKVLEVAGAAMERLDFERRIVALEESWRKD